MNANVAEERLHDLLIQQATDTLTAAETAELESLLAAHPQAHADYRSLVDALRAAPEPAPEALPPELARRVVAIGEAYVGTTTTAAGRRVVPLPVRRTSRERAAWFAAAASLVLAVLGWYPRLGDRPEPAPATVASVPPPPETVAGLREALLARPGVVTTQFTGGGDTGPAVEGDVVWDPESQRGFLRLRGLPANDPSRTQYQLWVFDAQRDPKYPVDGGVFDVPAGAIETVVPIRVPLKVGQVALFAVTVERPGGVVVSGRERIVATAKPSSST